MMATLVAITVKRLSSTICRALPCLRKTVPATDTAIAPWRITQQSAQATTTPPTLTLITDDSHWTLVSRMTGLVRMRWYCLIWKRTRILGRRGWLAVEN